MSGSLSLWASCLFVLLSTARLGADGPPFEGIYQLQCFHATTQVPEYNEAACHALWRLVCLAETLRREGVYLTCSWDARRIERGRQPLRACASQHKAQALVEVAPQPAICTVPGRALSEAWRAAAKIPPTAAT